MDLALQPGVCESVMDVRGVQQCDQDVDIQQCPHSAGCCAVANQLLPITGNIDAQNSLTPLTELASEISGTEFMSL